VDRVVVRGRPKYGPKHCELQAKHEGEWRLLGAFEMSPTSTAVVSLDPLAAFDSYRLVMLGSHDPLHPDRPRNVQVAELALYSGKQRLAGDTRSYPRIQDVEQKAYFCYPGAFTGTEAWHLLDTSDPVEGESPCRPGDVVDLSEQVKDGVLSWAPPPGRWKVLRFGYTITGSHVSTCSEGWDGLAIDYLDRGAFESYWYRVVQPILDEAGPLVGRSLRFLHTDSWELGPVNWTPRMPEQFARLRGYDMTPYLPCLAGFVIGDRETSTRFLNDFRRTLADLIAEGKYATFSEYAHARGLGIHPESGGPHAAPIDALRNLGLSDVPMGEFWARSKTHRVRDDQRLFVKQTSSAGHVYGKRLALAEAFTTIGPQWERDPRVLKPVFDRAACEGHNLTMWHTFDCSPKEMGLPGQAYFAGTHLNPNVTWWNFAGAFTDYLNRCHFLLQQGLFVADVLYFYGENIPSFVQLKRSDPAGVLPGYDYDVINADALLKRLSVKNGRLILPDGMSYRILVLPDHDAIDLGTLRHIESLVTAGATVVGRRPQRRLGLSGGVAADAEFQSICDTLWSADEGRVFPPSTAREVLEKSGIAPDFEYRGNTEATFLDYCHRVSDVAEVYFVVNRRNEPDSALCSFRVSGRQPELWDPVNGARNATPVFRQENGRTVIPLEFDPNGAVFVLFRKTITTGASREGERNRPLLEPRQELSGAWSVHFDPARGGPGSVVFDSLTSWHTREEPGIRHYSGKATYGITFDVPEEVLSESTGISLDLGEVENLARIRLNGQDLGVVWTRPFQVEVTDTVRAKRNHLEIEVVNLWPNRLIGDQSSPETERSTNTNITKFTKDSPLLPSGLLGPVTLLSRTGE
jgi:hypothetical protein